MVKLFSKNSNLCDHNPATLQTDRQTTCDHNTALCTKVHRAVINSINLTISSIISQYDNIAVVASQICDITRKF